MSHSKFSYEKINARQADRGIYASLEMMFTGRLPSTQPRKMRERLRQTSLSSKAEVELSWTKGAPS